MKSPVHGLGATAPSLALAILLLAGACAPVSEDAKEEIAKPIDCNTAAERSYNSDTETSEEFFQDKESVLTGDYNAAIDRKIADIKQTCGV
jgi:hypothetical protein